MLYTCSTEYCLALKKDEIMKFSGNWVDLGYIIEGEVTHSQEEINYIFSLMCGF